MNDRVHLDGVLCPFRSERSKRSSSSIDEVTCDRCREHVVSVGGEFMRARRNGAVAWLAGKPAVVSAARRILESQDAKRGDWRRLDLRRWLLALPVGEYSVTDSLGAVVDRVRVRVMSDGTGVAQQSETKKEPGR